MGVIDPREERFEDERADGIGRVAGADRDERERSGRSSRDDDADAPPVRRRYEEDVPRSGRDEDDLPRSRRFEESGPPRRRFDEDLDRPRRRDDEIDRPRREIEEDRPIRRVEWRRADEEDRPRRRELERDELIERPIRREPSAWEQRGGRYDDEERPRRRDDDEGPRRGRGGDEEVDHRAVLILAAIAIGALLLAASGALR
jgi:hypothetical protein